MPDGDPESRAHRRFVLPSLPRHVGASTINESPETLIVRSVFAFFAAMALCGPALSAAPSDASIQELMRVTGSQKIVDSVSAQTDALMQSSIQQALQGKALTPDMQKAVDNMRTKTVAVMKEELSWARLEPTFVDIYKRSFTQGEVDGMLEFYKSDVGQAVVAKMPVVMQNTMQLMQESMSSLMPKIQAIQKEFIEELKTGCRENCSPPKIEGA